MSNRADVGVGVSVHPSRDDTEFVPYLCLTKQLRRHGKLDGVNRSPLSDILGDGFLNTPYSTAISAVYASGVSHSLTANGVPT